MKTDYIGHDRTYQQRRHDPDYVGWLTHDELAADWQQIWQPLIQKPAFPHSGRLLELGCGAGNISIRLAQQGYDVVGVDIAPTAIAWAQENAAAAGVSAAFLVGDVLTLANLNDGSFDIVLDGHCFHCIIGPDRARFLQSAHRVLKVGGVLTICTMCNPDNPPPHFDPQTRCLVHNGIATRYLGDSNEILQAVMAAGFRILAVEVVTAPDPEGGADLYLIAEKLE
jgi:ubiquinone/menaquinone biosynthesis C-methylase UbiE